MLILWTFCWVQNEAICPQRWPGKQSVCHVGVLQPLGTIDVVKIWLLCFLIAGRKTHGSSSTPLLSVSYHFQIHFFTMKKLVINKTYFVCMWKAQCS